MEQHQQESLDLFINRYREDETILALLLGGSIAHGFSKPDSDIDIMIIVNEAEYQKRKQENKLAFSLWDICTYSGGYIDCKVVSVNFLQLIAERGSDPARYAFKDSVVLYSRIDNLHELLGQVIAFDMGQKDDRQHRFVSQLLAWKWYFSEAVKKQNNYLMHLSIQKIILFSCRLVLNENHLLYPYHKWLLAETGTAKNKPNNFDHMLASVMNAPTLDNVNHYVEEILSFLNVKEGQIDWPNQFLIDSEWNWVTQDPPVDDL